MKNLVLLTIFSLLLGGAFAQQQFEHIVQQEWVRTFSDQDSVRNIATDIDANGNIFVAGFVFTNSTKSDFILIKYDAQGNTVWFTKYDSPFHGNDRAIALTCDPAGNAYVTGTSENSFSNLDYLTIKYDNNGNELWTARYDNGEDDAPVAVEVDGAGNVYVAGTSFDVYHNDYLVVQYDGNGNQLWEARYTNNGYDDHCDGMKVDTQGNVYVTGGSSNGSNEDFVTIKYNNAGMEMWNERYNAPANGNDAATGIVLDNNNNVIVAGNSDGNNTGKDYLAIKYDNNGNLQWMQRVNAANGFDDHCDGLTVDANNNITLTGGSFVTNNVQAFNTIQYDEFGEQRWSQKYYGKGTVNNFAGRVVSSGNDTYVLGVADNGLNKDYVTIKYSNRGQEQWVQVFNGAANGEEQPGDIGVDPATGDVYVTGQSHNGNNFDIATVKYSKQPVVIPTDPSSDVPTVAHAYYQNKGQLRDVNGNLVPDIKYYSNTGVKHYFANNVMHMAWSRLDSIINDPDSLFRVDVSWTGEFAKPSAVHAFESVPGHLNYYWPHIPGGREGVNGFSRLIYPEIYDNIDLHVYSNAHGMKYYFVVKPGGDANHIALKFAGQDGYTIDNNGDLIIETELGNFKWMEGDAYRFNSNNNTLPINWTPKFVDLGGTIGFDIGNYPPSQWLVIKLEEEAAPPAGGGGNMTWSTYYGESSSDVAYDVTTDLAGNMYATGTTMSSLFPTAGGFSQSQLGGGQDAFVLSFAFNGVPRWATLYGGGSSSLATGNDAGYAVQANANGKVYVTGVTDSDNLPTINGGGYFDDTYNGRDAFVLKMATNNGFREWATYFGSATTDDYGLALAINSQNEVFIAGISEEGSNTLPLINPGGTTFFKDTEGSSFIARFDSDNNLTWSTRWGCGGTFLSVADQINDICIDSQDNIIIAGDAQIGIGSCNNYDFVDAGGYFENVFAGSGSAFLAKFNSGLELIWSTAFGGLGADYGKSVACDANDNIYLVGETFTNESTFPLLSFSPTGFYDNTHDGLSDAYLARFNMNHQLEWSTYYGGNGRDRANGVAVGYTDEVYVTGMTQSDNIHLISVPGAYNQSDLDGIGGNGSNQDGFLLALKKDAKPLWSTYLGGDIVAAASEEGHGVATNIQAFHSVYVVGASNSNDPNYPLFDPPGNSDYFQGSNAGSNDAILSEFDIDQIIAIAIDEESWNHVGMNVFPNPTLNSITIQLEEWLNDDVVVEIQNLLGERVVQEQWKNGLQKSIDLSFMASGTYILSVTLGDKTLNAKIIKK